MTAKTWRSWCRQSGLESTAGYRSRRRARPTRPSSAGNRARWAALVVRARRSARSNDRAERRLDNANAHVVRDLDLDLVIANLGHAPADAATGDDVVALFDGGQCCLMLL